MKTICGLVAVFFLGVCGIVSTKASDGEPFPLAEGTYWIYEGHVLFGGDSDKESEARVTGWKMEVVKAIRREGLVGAVVRGFPSDLDWSDGKAKAKESLVLESQDGGVYRVEDTEVSSSLERLRNPADTLRGLLRDEDLLLRFPLAQGKKFCDADGMARDDGMYCWVVMSAETASLDKIKGVTPGRRTVFTVRYATNPDDEEFDFVPGIGITAYGYHHHGTVAETELRLTEFHQGGNQ